MSPEYFFDSLISLTTICFHGNGFESDGHSFGAHGLPGIFGGKLGHRNTTAKVEYGHDPQHCGDGNLGSRLSKSVLSVASEGCCLF